MKTLWQRLSHLEHQRVFQQIIIPYIMVWKTGELAEGVVMAANKVVNIILRQGAIPVRVVSIEHRVDKLRQLVVLDVTVSCLVQRRRIAWHFKPPVKWLAFRARRISEFSINYPQQIVDYIQRSIGLDVIVNTKEVSKTK